MAANKEKLQLKDKYYVIMFWCLTGTYDHSTNVSKPRATAINYSIIC